MLCELSLQYHDEGAIDNGLDYSADDKKTSISNVMERDDLYTGGLSEHDLSENVKNAFTYSTNPNKTNIGTDGDIDLLVSGINCKPDTAALQFKADMNRFYRLGHKEQNYTRHTKRIMRAKLGKDGNPVLDKDGNMIYDETAPVYHSKDGKCVYQEFDQQMQARTAYMWVLSFYGKKELGYDPDPRLVHQIGFPSYFCGGHSSLLEVMTSHSLKASTGIRILVPTLIVGKSFILTSSYALGRDIPIWADNSCTLIVVLSITCSSFLEKCT